LLIKPSRTGHQPPPSNQPRQAVPESTLAERVGYPQDPPGQHYELQGTAARTQQGTGGHAASIASDGGTDDGEEEYEAASDDDDIIPDYNGTPGRREDLDRSKCSTFSAG
jgi:hypothetical protein